MTPMRNRPRLFLASLQILFCCAAQGLAAPPQPPAGIKASDKPWDAGDQIQVTIFGFVLRPWMPPENDPPGFR
jgi:hypothetical protein